MSDFYLVKTPHDLHRATDADGFRRRFRDRTGVDPLDVVRPYVAPGPPYPVILGGSIAAGLGSPASDVDLLVLLDDIDRFAPPSPDPRTMIFPGEPHSPLRAFVVHALEGLEVDVGIVDSSLLTARLDDVLTEGGSLSREQRRLCGRMLSGWPLAEPESAILDRLRRVRPALEARLAVSAMVDALKQLEDARAAVPVDGRLALHLSRLAAEAGFLVHLAAVGVLDAGDKWLRLFSETASAGWSDNPGRSATIARQGLPLVFPSQDDDPDIQVERTAAFLRRVRDDAALDRRLEIAFSLCPQVHDV